jgi:hypothetical protein
MSTDTLFDGEEQEDSVPKPTDESKSDVEVAARYKLSPITLTVFKRENDSGTFYEANIQRAYTRDNGESFEYTGSLRPRDLRKASRLYEKAADDLQGFEVQSGGGQ